MSGTATEDGGASELYRRIYQLVDLEYDLLLIACLAHLIPRACLSLIADRSDDGMLEEGDDGMTSFGRAMSIFRSLTESPSPSPYTASRGLKNACRQAFEERVAQAAVAGVQSRCLQILAEPIRQLLDGNLGAEPKVIGGEMRLGLVAVEELDSDFSLTILEVEVPGVSTEDDLRVLSMYSTSIFGTDNLSLGLGLGRLLNHSCIPNVYQEIGKGDSIVSAYSAGICAKISIITRRPIPKGEELTMYYQEDYFDKSNYYCQCTARCKPGPSTIDEVNLRIRNQLKN